MIPISFRSNIDYARWADWASAVKETQVGGASVEPKDVAQGATDWLAKATDAGLSDELVKLYRRHPVLAELDDRNRQRVLAATGPEVLPAITTLVEKLSYLSGSKGLSFTPEAHYRRHAELLEEVVTLRAAAAAAGLSERQFPFAELAELEREVRSALGDLAKDNGAQVEAHPWPRLSVLERAYEGRAAPWFEAFEALLQKGADHPLLKQAMRTLHDEAEFPRQVESVRYEVSGLFRRVKLAVTSRAAEAGRPLSLSEVHAEALKKAENPIQRALIEQLSLSCGQQPTSAIARSFDRNLGLTNFGKLFWARFSSFSPVGRLLEEAQPQLDAALAKQGYRALNARDLLAVILALAGDDPVAAAQINQACLDQELRPIAGIPPALAGPYAEVCALIDRLELDAKNAKAEVAALSAKIGAVSRAPQKAFTGGAGLDRAEVEVRYAALLGDIEGLRREVALQFLSSDPTYNRRIAELQDGLRSFRRLLIATRAEIGPGAVAKTLDAVEDYLKAIEPELTGTLRALATSAAAGLDRQLDSAYQVLTGVYYQGLRAAIEAEANGGR